jgi:hypothetical protein
MVMIVESKNYFCLFFLFSLEGMIRKVVYQYIELVGFGRAARTRLFGLINTPKRALRASPSARSIAASLLLVHPPEIKITYFQKQKASLQAQTRAARGVYLTTGLSCTLLSYIAPY